MSFKRTTDEGGLRESSFLKQTLGPEFNPQRPCGKQGTVIPVYNPHLCEAEAGGSLGLLASSLETLS